jgi:hypoxanthine phosphoribosyltransferase
MSTGPGPASILIDAKKLDARITEMARLIAADLGPVAPLAVVVLEGARTFGETLCARLPWGGRFESVRVSSYGNATVSSGEVRLVRDVEERVADRTVLLLEDIVDTGRTVLFLTEHFRKAGARDVVVATLLSKPSRRVVSVPIRYVGFEIPDCFVIGFGMDAGGKYRELPHVAVLDGAELKGPRP